MVVEGIIANSVTAIMKKLSSVLVDEITLVWGFKDELKNLQITLNMIVAVMEDAKKKQLSDALVRLWMQDLKAIAYDAEDILDDYSYEVNLFHKRVKKEKIKSTVFNKVRKLFPNSKPSYEVIRNLAQQIKEINEKFNKIAERKNKLGLQVGSSSSQHELMMNRETYSFVPDWKIVGRENDKSKIIKMLLEEEEENSSNNQGDGGKNVSVIPIVGMGGLGKTTMAQQVYNDEVVQKHFQKKIWIFVSVPFEVKKLLTNIASYFGVTARQYDDIVCQLGEALRKKKFLLVLDDVWKVNFEDWHKLKTPLMGGAKGSKILVTTRMEKVALMIVDKFQPYSLDSLKENDSWYLFNEITFGCAAAGVVQTPKLMEIGKKMVKRCGGLPLAVIFLGCLMRSKKKEEEWKIIRDTKVWHESREGEYSEILPSLRLSYDYLPSHLKLCFSYCCLFPKDSIINRKKLIRLWMAEGFLIESPVEDTMSMEDIGNKYFHSLLSNFFFQDVKKDKDGDIATCKMHDLVHDLACSVAEKNECLIVKNAHDIDYISEETRRLNLLVDHYDEEMLPKVLEALKKAKNLRTILFKNQRFGFDIGDAFKENKRLRVFDDSSEFVTRESSSSSMISKKKGSPSSSIGGLKHLRYLVVEGVWFPKGIGRLSFLQTLSGFSVGDKKKNKNASVIEELEGLNFLTGDLSISHLQNVTSETKACRANLKEKKNLSGLNLIWDWGYAKNVEAVLEGLRPHPNLRTLWINYFGGAKLPRWIGDSSCLPNLVELELTNLKKVECIGNKFYFSTAAGGEATTTTTTAFPSLKKLTLRSMPSLEEWVIPVPPLSTTTLATTNYCFPLLEEIKILSCPKLSTITPTTTIFPSLKVLYLEGIDESAVKTLLTNNLNSLTSLRLFEIPKLISLPRHGLIENNNTLLFLEIAWCVAFEGFFPPNNEEEEGHDDDDHDQGGGQQLQISQVVSSSSSSSSSSCSSSSLQSLTLFGCPAVRYYPNFCSLTSLRTLEIQEGKESESLLNELTCRSSSSSSSSLENLELVRIMIKSSDRSATDKEVFEWRKSEYF